MLGKQTLGLLNRVAKLGVLRLILLVLMLIQNVLIVRFLPLEEIGWYYLMVTVAYLGNAAMFVGADFYLQRQLAYLSVDQPLYRPALAKYMLLTAALGSIIVLVTSVIYFSTAASIGWLEPVLICTALSMATYFSTLGRNLCQLAAYPVYSTLGPIGEGIFRAAALCGLVAVTGKAYAGSVAVLSIIGALFSAVITWGLLLKAKKGHEKAEIGGDVSNPPSYLNSPRQLGDAVLSIGASGILNWAQLQGYRPLLISSSSGGATIVGTVSFLSTLGSTTSNAVFTILAQIQVPQQYRSKGASTSHYLLILGGVTLGLSIACLPAGALFLWISNKWQLLEVVYLVAVGVLVEAGNAAIGVCTHHMNAQGKTLWGLPQAGLIGCMATFIMLLMPMATDPYIAVAIALVIGQALTVSIVLYLTFRPE